MKIGTRSVMVERHIGHKLPTFVHCNLDSIQRVYMDRTVLWIISPVNTRNIKAAALPDYLTVHYPHRSLKRCHLFVDLNYPVQLYYPIQTNIVPVCILLLHFLVCHYLCSSFCGGEKSQCHYVSVQYLNLSQ